MQLELFSKKPCGLGEGIFYAEGRLCWFDINNKHLYFCNQNGKGLKKIQLPERFSTGAYINSERLFLVSETALWYFNLSTYLLERYMDLESKQSYTRSNDGRIDRYGGFWIGTMDKQANTDRGKIYRYYQGELITLYENIYIPNAICFSPLGDYAYFADSKKQIIYRCKLDKAGWPINEAVVWVDISETDFSPDGAVVDSQGYLWNAQWDGARLVRYSPNGDEDCIIHFPISRPTCLTFGGENYSNLYVTSAYEGLTSAQRQKEPLAGCVFQVPVPVHGLPEKPLVINSHD